MLLLRSVAWFLVGCQLLSVASAGGSGSALSGFQLSLYSYYDTVTSTAYSEPLTKFLHSTGISTINQFVCESFDPQSFAEWTKLTRAAGTKTHVMFDNAVWPTSTSCQEECVTSVAPPVANYCCGGIDAKLEWVRQVVEHGGLIDGINFDIENLKSVQNQALYRTVASLRNQVFRNQQPPLGASFDVIERGTFNQLLAEGSLDRVYVENYFNDPDVINTNIGDVLDNAASLAVPPKGGLSFMVETSCCVSPCDASQCSACPSSHPNQPLPSRSTKSFCKTSDVSQKQGIERMVNAVSNATSYIHKSPHARLVAPGGIGAYEYRTLHILLTGKDPPTGLCAAR